MLEIIQFRKDWWKLELEGMLQILQSNFISNFTDGNNLKNLRLFQYHKAFNEKIRIKPECSDYQHSAFSSLTTSL